MITPELKTFLNVAHAAGHRVFSTPISRLDFTGRGSWNDYQQEMKSIKMGGDHRWSGESEKKVARYKSDTRLNLLPKKGWIFCYIHQDKSKRNGGTVEFYEIEGTSYDYRSWWNEGNRDVIHLGTDLKGRCTVEEFCDHIIKFNFKNSVDYGKEGTRFAGNRIYNWIPNYRTEIEHQINSPTNTAFAWENIPSSLNINICRKIAGLINDNKPNSVYQNQYFAAAKTFEMMTDPSSGNKGIAIGDLQSGKTGQMVTLCHAFPEMIAAKEEKDPKEIVVGIIAVSNISQTTLFEQSQARFAESGFSGRIIANKKVLESTLGVGRVILHTEMLSNRVESRLDEAVNVLQEAGVTHTVFLMDETQTAMKSGQQFSKFLIKHKWISQNSGSNVWAPPIYVLGITATALQQFVLPDVEGIPKLFYSYSPPGEGYYGIDQMLLKNRIKDIDIDEWKMKDYERSINDNPLLNDGATPKYVIVRLPVIKNGVDKLNIETIFGNISAQKSWDNPKEFNANEKNIDLLNPQLATQPEKHCVLFIKNAAKAGDTFETVKHIGSAYDIRFKNVEAQIQALTGRSCGYAQDRKDAMYPIFTNKEQLERYYDVMMKCANGDPVDELRRNLSTKQSKYVLHLIDGLHIQPHHLVFGTYEEWKNLNTPNLHLTINHLKRTTTKMNRVVNVSKILTGNTTEVVRNHAAFFDCSEVPSEPSMASDYNLLISTYPQLQDLNVGCWIDRTYLKSVVSHEYGKGKNTMNETS